MKPLVKQGFNQKDVISFGNMFLLGNGRYGYRGTLEEFRKEEMVGLNALAFYDQYQDKWREPVNLPNPFFVLAESGSRAYSVLNEKPLSHEVRLDLEDALFSRHTDFGEVEITSSRFLSMEERDLLACTYTLRAKKDIALSLTMGLDLDIYESNGPHFKSKKSKTQGNTIVFKGITNEEKKAVLRAKYSVNKGVLHTIDEDGIRGFRLETELAEGEEIRLLILCHIGEEETESFSKTFAELLLPHQIRMRRYWEDADVEIDGDERAQFELRYSIYHLLILLDPTSYHSVPARGVSGQTYKGAIFWDTEMFMMPFYALVHPAFARNTLVYRIRTLEGAKKKALKYGYKGAFYAWESQEDGVERCSDYNVTDPVTNEPIRTYFADKQIHISGDVALAFYRYVVLTGDETILREGGYEVIYETIKFYLSYLSREEEFHLRDVIGPDEYHERIDDNAYTNALLHEVLGLGIRYFDAYIDQVHDRTLTKAEMKETLQKLYVPSPNDEGIIEQFQGYLNLEDTTPAEVKSRIRNEREYLGGKDGVASKTRVIKQADVLAELILLDTPYDEEVLRKNYDFYRPYTEHGSSLSSSIYSLAASKLGRSEDAYVLFRKASGIDLGLEQKMYAGGIYIGGTHPASNAGAYLCAVLGFAGLTFGEEGFSFHPSLPHSIQGMRFKFFYKGKQYLAHIHHDATYDVKEVNSHD